MLTVIAAFFTLAAFNNITDYATNRSDVDSVLTMEGITSTNVLWRAIQSQWIIASAYHLIIANEATVALFCWVSVILRLSKTDDRLIGLIGLTLAFMQFMFGFVVVAGEWFYMWQHPVLAGLQQKAAVLALVMLTSMIFISSKDSQI